VLEVDPKHQRNPDALSKLYVRSSMGALVPIDSVARMKRDIGPLNINHFGQLPAVTVNFNLRPGFSLGQAAQGVEEAIRELRMPATIGANFQGTVREFQESFRNLTVLLIVAVLVIYIVLGILYESFIHPITILSGLPSAVFGALLTLMIFGKEIDLYHRSAPRRGERLRCHLARLPASFPADHDDDGGGAVRHAADRARLRRRRRRAAAARARGGGRPGGESVPDALHHAGDLSLSRAGAGVPARPESGGRGARSRAGHPSRLSAVAGGTSWRWYDPTPASPAEVHPE
jgi:hypothetical protein